MARLKDRNDFAIVTVSLDNAQTLDGLRDIMQQYNIKHPVLWFGPEDTSWGALDWNVRAVPTAYLIDPQGNILLDTYVTDTFAADMVAIMDHTPQFPPISMEWTHSKQPDGSYRMDLHLSSPTHVPLGVTVNFAKVVKEYKEERDGQWVKVDPIPEGKTWNCYGYYPLSESTGFNGKVEFGKFCDSMVGFTLPGMADAWMISCNATVTLPGTEQMLDGRGVVITSHSDIYTEEPAAQ